MAYSFQTFTVGQVLTAGQVNQIEVNIRDHQHGVAGVTGSGMTFASPVFTTQITTPKIVTASGALEITPAGNADIILQGSGTGNIGFAVSSPSFRCSFPSGAPIGWELTTGQAASRKWGINNDQIAYGDFALRTEATQGGGLDTTRIYINPIGNIGIRTTAPFAALHLPAGTAAASTAPFKFTSGTLLTIAEAGAVEFLSDAFYATITTGAVRKTFAFLESPSFTTPALGTPASGVLTNCTGTAAGLTAGNATTAGGFTPSQAPGANNIVVLNASGVMAAGTVPLARMMRTEVQGSGTATYLDIDCGTVVAGDRILVTANTPGVSDSAYLQIYNYGTCSGNFAGSANIYQYSPANSGINIGSIFEVTAGGTFVLRVYALGTNPPKYAHAIVLNNG